MYTPYHKTSPVIRAGALVFTGNLRDYKEINQDVDQVLYSWPKPISLSLVVSERSFIFCGKGFVCSGVPSLFILQLLSSGDFPTFCVNQLKRFIIINPIFVIYSGAG